jgi:hypothetical protein
MEINEQLEDHEKRIKSLEQTSIEMKCSLLTIGNDQKDMKIMLMDLLNRLVNCTLDVTKVNIEEKRAENEIKQLNYTEIWKLIKKIWTWAAPFIGALIALYIKSKGGN